MYICIHTYVYIYIHREREGDIDLYSTYIMICRSSPGTVRATEVRAHDDRA